MKPIRIEYDDDVLVIVEKLTLEKTDAAQEEGA